ncbi:MAG: dTDP-4-dehydrorhamnose reductase [Planctomycetota bacterium]
MIWLTGSSGLLGREVLRLADACGRPLVGRERRVDIGDRQAVLAMARRHQPVCIVNCAAYTRVDAAETDEATAMRVNALGPMHLAEAALETGAVLVHVSTDYVFDGSREHPYTEEDPPAPLGVYGRSKLAGEEVIRASGAAHVIVRTSWLHGPLGRSFVGTVLGRMQRGESLRVVADQQGAPTYAEDLASVLLAIADAGPGVGGTFHAVNAGSCSWFELALEVQAQARSAGLLAKGVEVVPVATNRQAGAARRPAHSVLSTERLQASLGWKPPPWQDGVARHLARLRHGNDAS